jgi:hypothetical protein
MKNRFIQFLLLICFLSLSASAFGQNDNKSKLRQEPDFKYMSSLDSLLREKQRIRMDTIHLNNKDKPVFQNNNRTGNSLLNRLFTSPAISFLFQLLAVIIILFLLYHLVLKNILFSKRKNSYSSDYDGEVDVELNDASHYNYLIRQSESNKEYNLAIKYYFLLVLKTLDELQFIHFSPDKTNEYYIQEIKGGDQQKKFAALARIYDYVWYGKFETNNDQYQNFKRQFDNFLLQIN